jgi:hypothetical protein
MDHVRLVDRRAARRKVSRGTQIKDLARGEHGLRRAAGGFEQALGLVVQLQARQNLFMADAAPGVGVD